MWPSHEKDSLWPIGRDAAAHGQAEGQIGHARLLTTGADLV